MRSCAPFFGLLPSRQKDIVFYSFLSINISPKLGVSFFKFAPGMETKKGSVTTCITTASFLACPTTSKRILNTFIINDTGAKCKQHRLDKVRSKK